MVAATGKGLPILSAHRDSISYLYQYVAKTQQKSLHTHTPGSSSQGLSVHRVLFSAPMAQFGCIIRNCFACFQERHL